MGHTFVLVLPSRENGREPESDTLPGISFLRDYVCPELSEYVAPASMLEVLVRSSPLFSLSSAFPLWCILLSALSAKPALCLFVLGMFCLFWDIESSQLMRFIGCLPTALATQPPTLLLWLSFICRGFTCKHVTAVFSFTNKGICCSQTSITRYNTLNCYQH